ncbi:MAG: PolC-type DNA polymerase III [Lachnospiraceae bacterium]|nr:PolC-type DNA polymerase III [Lachnospiraceae bacterium]
MKKLSEVLPSFSGYEGELKNLFEIAEVEHVSAPPDMSYLNIHVCIPRLIDKELISRMEQIIKNQVFPEKEIRINIIERFILSEHYNPETLFNSYKQSIYSELKERNFLEYRLLTHSDIAFFEDGLTLNVENNSINKHLAEDLAQYLRSVFNDRCGIMCSVTCNYIDTPKKNTEYKEEYAVPQAYTKQKEEFIQPEDIKANAAFLSADKDTKPVKKESRRKSNYVKKAVNPDVIYGRDFDDEITPIKEIYTEMTDVTVKGKICDLESRHIESKNLDLYSFTLTDFTDSICVKMFVKEEDNESFKDAVHNGDFVRLRGTTMIDRFDKELSIGSVRGIKKCENLSVNKRTDNAALKRVELHCHTKMSENDGVTSAEDIIKRVSKWGMDAIAITDHGNVQAFPEALHTIQKMENPPKIIYGVEGYLVDDMTDIITNPGEYTTEGSFVVFDIESTGLSVKDDRVIEIGAVKIENGEITDRFSAFVNPEMPIPFRIEELTGINDSMVSNAPAIRQILPEFISFCEGCAVVAHNASFDTGMIIRDCIENNINWNPTIVDTVTLSHLLLPHLAKYKLDYLAKALEISLENHHRAVDDAECTALIFMKLCKMLNEKDIYRLSDIQKLSESNPDFIKKQRTYHVIILIKNETGRVNLYRLISYAHIDYFSKRPRIPKSLLEKYREGLIVGSACEAGELYTAILKGYSEQELKRIVDFYDYLEIQPLGNNMFMLEDDTYPVNSREQLIDINKQIANLGEKYNKPVVATGDVHFLDPDDEIYRRIIMFGMGFEDADRQPPLYLRTTEEMLREFDYLGQEKAFEVVVTNSRMIADSVDKLSPVRPDKCPPVIPDSEKILKESCYANAHRQYGDVLPEIVEKRLIKELDSIINNGFSVMYIIAKKLVEKSNSDGYLVGSRGSVGSSFAAYTSGITEVNPLPPHYYCANCRYSEFDTPEVKAFAGKAGCDMPDKICPVCGSQLKKDGFDIPFETFLGFNGDKEPDIDLNFSGEYQSRAHAETEVIFGKGHTFRAGTVGSIAEKTAFGYVKKYFEEHGENKRKCEINRLLKGCVGVKRTTGQHPGGIIVLPHGEEIYSFTPVQRPANDQTSDTITTHFDYHAIDHNLLKLDILGHQAPTMIRMLQDLTGIDPVKDIPLDSKETMSLFKSTEALGIKPSDISGCQLGSLGIPEFGTDFAMQMLIDADPNYFSDLVRIAGLAHGTDVWIGNAHDLITSGQATISTAICTRDDIMIYLIQKGMDPGESFKIMESVRKGKGLKPDQEEHMVTAGVPEWYINSCKKIKYMFPKAHAAAYVMMSWRIAYCKIFYPQAYYAAYFSIMGNGFSYELMGQGLDKLRYVMKDYKSRQDSLSPREEEQYRDMRIAEEMYARGIEMLPIDLYKSRGTSFTIEDGKLRPCFTSIDGLGESVGKLIEEEAAKGRFISKDDFRSRCKAGRSICDLLDSFGVLKGIPETDQISFFDSL